MKVTIIIEDEHLKTLQGTFECEAVSVDEAEGSWGITEEPYTRTGPTRTFVMLGVSEVKQPTEREAVVAYLRDLAVENGDMEAPMESVLNEVADDIAEGRHRGRRIEEPWGDQVVMVDQDGNTVVVTGGE